MNTGNKQQVNRQDNGDDGEAEQQNEAPGVTARLFLMAKEVHTLRRVSETDLGCVLQNFPVFEFQ